MYKKFLKRIIDIIASIIGLLLLSPLMIILIIILSFINNGKPFFSQKRPGKNKRIFSLFKFKSMNDKKDKNGTLLPDNQRITKTGAFIRKTSLDEIPQLFNVLKGDMSLIGPRPLLVSYLDLYNEIQNRRHDVRPGISGWAQVNGRNAISWEEKFNLDVWYVENISFKIDIKIIILTIKKVILKEDINNQKDLNMPPFLGKN